MHLCLHVRLPVLPRLPRCALQVHLRRHRLALLDVLERDGEVGLGEPAQLLVAALAPLVDVENELARPARGAVQQRAQEEVRRLLVPARRSVPLGALDEPRAVECPALPRAVVVVPVAWPEAAPAARRVGAGGRGVEQPHLAREPALEEGAADEGRPGRVEHRLVVVLVAGGGRRHERPPRLKASAPHVPQDRGEEGVARRRSEGVLADQGARADLPD
mmetsp:Transcript_30038/g.96108  ORF Transcript_30038/g.96108 Transcript_30038/m.96108 type:complete len:218 (-) Transcript_30038:429-1082(-)